MPYMPQNCVYPSAQDRFSPFTDEDPATNMVGSALYARHLNMWSAAIRALQQKILDVTGPLSPYNPDGTTDTSSWRVQNGVLRLFGPVYLKSTGTTLESGTQTGVLLPVLTGTTDLQITVTVRYRYNYSFTPALNVTNLLIHRNGLDVTSGLTLAGSSDSVGFQLVVSDVARTLWTSPATGGAWRVSFDWSIQ